MHEILYADNLQSITGLRHGFYTRAWGNCGQGEKFDQKQQTTNRGAVALSMGVRPENLLSCNQVHTPDVVTVTEIWSRETRPKADAMVTKMRGLALGILTADCGPLLFVDHRAQVIGAAHAGWRGALTGVIENTIAAMEKLGAHRRYTHVALGACIGKFSYEVGAEFPAPFLAEDPAHEKLFRPSVRTDHYMFDLPGYIENKVQKIGVASFSPTPADTCADEARFFSYRRNTLRNISPTESLISTIALVE